MDDLERRIGPRGFEKVTYVEPRSWTNGDDREFLSAVDVPDKATALKWFIAQGAWNELPIEPRIEPRLVCDHEEGDPHPADCVQVWEKVWTIDQ